MNHRGSARATARSLPSSSYMRENGVEDFPDPDSNGHVLYDGDDPDMTSASEKCDALLAADQG